MSYFNLSPRTGPADSPGSSVFDLPTQSARKGINTEHPSVSITPVTQNLDLDPRHHEDGPSFVVISGGTGCNSICSAFGNACYVLPVSDDGGSSSEIIRVLGGPSIGDIRSRLIRLIPPAPQSSPLDSIRNLLAYRFPAHCSEREARDEWREIVEGRSTLWTGIPNDRKELIRGIVFRRPRGESGVLFIHRILGVIRERGSQESAQELFVFERKVRKAAHNGNTI
ncbi:hypothetical protein PHLCEN_2v5775 [Hermanssonia centrifuga]|uniref:Uncharacterized protein n=1 Tax=Hermanssonia centrifuga TaxID=98765 RepID=A0A2R6P1G0_9APHY|nr:hypothetical protein PHLCEN_2v5775 [Hermanssonia centrifuga]